MMLSRSAFVALGAGAFVAGATCGSAGAADGVAFDLRSAFWMNLHHRLYRQAEIVAATSHGTSLAQMRPSRWLTKALALQAEFDALPPAVRSQWDPALHAYVAGGWTDRDLLLDDRMTALKAALAALRDDALPAVSRALPVDIRDALVQAAPGYRATLWTSDDAANRAWIDAVRPLIGRYGTAVAARLRAVYAAPWPLGPYRVDVVRHANFLGAYTSAGPVHIIIASGEPAFSGLAALEMLFHERSHGVVTPDYGSVGTALEDAATQLHVPEPDGLWHAVIFYTAGRIVADVLAAEGRNYTPYADANDVYSGTWREFRTALGATWQPYLDGRTSMTQAAVALTRAVTAAHP